MALQFKRKGKKKQKHPNSEAAGPAHHAPGRCESVCVWGGQADLLTSQISDIAAGYLSAMNMCYGERGGGGDVANGKKARASEEQRGDAGVNYVTIPRKRSSSRHGCNCVRRDGKVTEGEITASMSGFLKGQTENRNLKRFGEGRGRGKGRRAGRGGGGIPDPALAAVGLSQNRGSLVSSP